MRAEMIIPPSSSSFFFFFFFFFFLYPALAAGAIYSLSFRRSVVIGVLSA